MSNRNRFPLPSLSRHLSYANVVATLALVLALGGGAAIAATKLPKQSVGSAQLRSGAVTGAKVKDGSLTGADLAVASLGEVPAAGRAQTAGLAERAREAERAATATRADSAVTAAPSGAAGGDLAGAYPQPEIAPKAIGAEELADAGVTAAALAPASVARETLQTGAVSGRSLGQIYEMTDQFKGNGFIHSAGSSNVLSATCPPSARVIGGGYATGVIGAANITSSSRRGNGWGISGVVPGTSSITVQVIAYCLA